MALLDSLKRWLLEGLVITIPLVLTILLLLLILRFIFDLLDPLVDGFAYLWPNDPPVIVLQAATLLAMLGLFILVGLVAEHTPGRFTSSLVHRSVERVPGIQLVYSTIRRAVYLLMSEDTRQFREVKLVEFPHANSYMVGFLIRDATDAIKQSVDRADLVTVMMPLGPNPTTNGFIMHMPPEVVHDVDLSVEEAIRSIVTLGVDIEHGEGSLSGPRDAGGSLVDPDAIKSPSADGRDQSL